MKTPKTENKTKQKTKTRLLVLCLQAEDGTIERILTGTDYDQLWMQGSAESKAIGGYWSTYDNHGRFIDGNYRSKAIK